MALRFDTVHYPFVAGMLEMVDPRLDDFIAGACRTTVAPDTSWYKRIEDPQFLYELIKPVSIKLPVALNDCQAKFHDKSGPFVLFIKGNKMTVRPPYRWDGASYAPDFKDVMVPALVHDILYDAIKSGYQPTSSGKEADFQMADALFMSLMKAEGFFLKDTYYSAVRYFGGRVRKKNNGDLFIVRNV